MHGVVPCDGQLSRPSALLTATIDSVISFATSGGNFPGPAGAGFAAPSAARSVVNNKTATFMAASLRPTRVAQQLSRFGCDGRPQDKKNPWHALALPGVF